MQLKIHENLSLSSRRIVKKKEKKETEFDYLRRFKRHVRLRAGTPCKRIFVYTSHVGITVAAHTHTLYARGVHRPPKRFRARTRAARAKRRIMRVRACRRRQTTSGGDPAAVAWRMRVPRAVDPTVTPEEFWVTDENRPRQRSNTRVAHWSTSYGVATL